MIDDALSGTAVDRHCCRTNVTVLHTISSSSPVAEQNDVVARQGSNVGETTDSVGVVVNMLEFTARVVVLKKGSVELDGVALKLGTAVGKSTGVVVAGSEGPGASATVDVQSSMVKNEVLQSIVLFKASILLPKGLAGGQETTDETQRSMSAVVVGSKVGTGVGNALPAHSESMKNDVIQASVARFFRPRTLVASGVGQKIDEERQGLDGRDSGGAIKTGVGVRAAGMGDDGNGVVEHSGSATSEVVQSTVSCLFPNRVKMVVVAQDTAVDKQLFADDGSSVATGVLAAGALEFDGSRSTKGSAADTGRLKGDGGDPSTMNGVGLPVNVSSRTMLELATVETGLGIGLELEDGRKTDVLIGAKSEMGTSVTGVGVGAGGVSRTVVVGTGGISRAVVVGA